MGGTRRDKMSEEEKSQEASQEQNLEVTPENKETNEQVPENQDPPEGKPPKEAATKPESWEYNGNRKEVPKEFQKYSKGFDQYVSRKDQELAEARKQLEEAQQKLSSVPKPTQTKESQPLVTQDELDAIALGDGKVLESVINRAVDIKMKSDPNREQVASISQKQSVLDARDRINEFAAITPEFKELIESPIGDHIIAAVQRGNSLEKAWEQAKEAMSFMEARSESKRKTNLENKINGSTVKNTVTGKSDTVWVENETEAKRMAIELTLKKDPRKVGIKPKK